MTFKYIPSVGFHDKAIILIASFKGNAITFNKDKRDVAK
jgi:hypothetical protein